MSPRDRRRTRVRTNQATYPLFLLVTVRSMERNGILYCQFEDLPACREAALNLIAHQAVVFTVEALPEEEFWIMDKSVSGLMVIRLMFSSCCTRLSVLVELEAEPLVDVCSAATRSLTRVGSDSIMFAFAAERRTLYMESVEVDPELPVRAL